LISIKKLKFQKFMHPNILKITVKCKLKSLFFWSSDISVSIAMGYRLDSWCLIPARAASRSALGSTQPLPI
jgi:hypothetical protein